MKYTNTYIDTRGVIPGDAAPSFTKAIIKGIAPGGGLFVPKVIPQLELSEIGNLAELTYAQQAAFVFERFGVDLATDKTEQLMAAAYGSNFNDPAVAPVKTIASDTHVLELWHGPTSAFKDMALQCLPQFFSTAVEQLRAAGAPEAANDFLILVATSGDTGKAALEGFADRDHTSIIVYYPDGGVSDVQLAQMVTQQGANLSVYGLRGNFDDCQTAVKGAFASQTFNDDLAAKYHLQLSSANSINWGRLLPQVVYYVSAYAQLVAAGKVSLGRPIDVCVPTGNFGNILAAYYAAEIGVPIERLLCASNDNRVLCDFINTGTYDISNREFVLTPSPSMDILVSSNLERQLFELAGRDAERIAAWMQELSQQQKFTVDRETFAAMRQRYAADWVSSSESLATIKEVYQQYDYLLDPHTAVAWKVAERLRDQNPVLVVSTAHWAKFGADVYRGLTGLEAGAALPAKVANLSGLELDKYISQNYSAAGPLPQKLAALAGLTPRFTQTSAGNTDSVEQTVLDWLASR
jgi:threonine synthase